MPSLSPADALSPIVAGATNVAPFAGFVSATVGGLFGGPAVVKLQTGPSAVMNAIVFDTIFQ